MRVGRIISGRALIIVECIGALVFLLLGLFRHDVPQVSWRVHIVDKCALRLYGNFGDVLFLRATLATKATFACDSAASHTLKICDETAPSIPH